MFLRFCFTFTFLLSVVSLAFATADPAAPTTTIRANTRLVVVDVVAVDNHGQPVPGLKASDFSVFENKKPQSIRGFDEHKSTASTTAPPINLPPNVYTNFISPQNRGPVTILLFDMLNTETSHLEFAKQQVLGFLRKLPPHQQVAMFTLGTQLHMIQGPTEDEVSEAPTASSTPSPGSTQNLENKRATVQDCSQNLESKDFGGKFLERKDLGRLR